VAARNVEGNPEALGVVEEGSSDPEKGSEEASSSLEANVLPRTHLGTVLEDKERIQGCEARLGPALGTAYLLSDGRRVDFVGLGTKDSLGLGVWIEG